MSNYIVMNIAPPTVLLKDQNRMPTFLRYRRVQDILSSDLALMPLLGPKDYPVESRSGEKIMVSNEVVQVANAIHFEGKDANKIPKSEVLSAAVRILNFLATQTPATVLPSVPPVETKQQREPNQKSEPLTTGTSPNYLGEKLSDTAPEFSTPESIEIKHGEAKGIYQVHPVACFFPLLVGEQFSDLKKSIQTNGQQDPIVLYGNILLDGRNRLLALNELGKVPKIIQFTEIVTSLTEGDWIAAKNLQRRHLTDDQRLAIVARYYAWRRGEEARRLDVTRKSETICPLETRNGDGAKGEAEHSQAVEKLHTYEFPQNPAENAGKRKRGRPRGGVRSDAENIAAETKQSRYRAEQMLKLQNYAPELFQAVEKQGITLKEAMRQFTDQQQPKKSKSKRGAKEDKVAKAVHRANSLLLRMSSKFAEAEKIEFWKRIAAMSASIIQGQSCV